MHTSVCRSTRNTRREVQRETRWAVGALCRVLCCQAPHARTAGSTPKLKHVLEPTSDIWQHNDTFGDDRGRSQLRRLALVVHVDPLLNVSHLELPRNLHRVRISGVRSAKVQVVGPLPATTRVVADVL